MIVVLSALLLQTMAQPALPYPQLTGAGVGLSTWEGQAVVSS